MNPEEKDFIEIIRYFDGSLDEAEMKDFSRKLMDDAELRAEFREVAEQAVHLGDIGRGKRLSEKEAKTDREYRPKSVIRLDRLELWGAAAAVIIAIGVMFWFSRESAPGSIATLEVADGTVRWTQSDGLIFDDPSVGTELGAGSLSVEGASGTAQIRFRDNTLLTFGGETEVHLSEREGRKFIVLDRGDVTAEVSKQPDRSPLTVITPAAEIEVLGTVLSVSAGRLETSLAVDEGRVAIRSRANGKRIELPAGQRIVASLDPQKPMVPEKETELLTHWKLDHSDPNANLVTKGNPILIDGRSGLEAEVYVAGRREDGSKHIRRGVAINGPGRMGIPYAQLRADSNLRIRYRIDDGEAGGLSVFLGTKRQSGGFGGNFDCWVSKTESRTLDDGLREAVIPLSDFELVESLRKRGRTYRLDENELSKILISVSEDRQLEVVAVSLATGEEPVQ